MVCKLIRLRNMGEWVKTPYAFSEVNLDRLPLEGMK